MIKPLYTNNSSMMLGVSIEMLAHLDLDSDYVKVEFLTGGIIQMSKPSTQEIAKYLTGPKRGRPRKEERDER